MRALAPCGMLLTAATAHAQCIPAWKPPVPGPRPNQEVRALCNWDPDGPGPAPPVVVAGGNFHVQNGSVANFVALWNGQSWQSMGPATAVDGTVEAVALYDPDGTGSTGPQPVIGGVFHTVAGVLCNRVARWDGAAWQPLGAGVGAGFQDVKSLVEYQGDLIAGGVFGVAGGQEAFGLARWDGVAWSPFLGGASFVDALYVWNGDLIAGSTPGVSRWNGKAWSFLIPSNHLDEVLCLGEFGGDLIAGGAFNLMTSLHSHIARFDGAQWRDLSTGTNGTVWAVTSWDPDGPGPAGDLLIAGGNFSVAGGLPATGIAAWNGTQWSALGSGLDGGVRALAKWNGDVVVGGGFVTAGGIFSPKFARYGCPDCEPDCNGDGLLNLSDFGCFQTRFAVGNMLADCNRDGLLQLSDFGCFITKYALGCP